MLRVWADWVGEDTYDEWKYGARASRIVYFRSERHFRLSRKRKKILTQPQFRHLKAKLSFY